MPSTDLALVSDSGVYWGFFTPSHLRPVARAMDAVREAGEAVAHAVWMAETSPLPCDYCGHVGPRRDYCDLDSTDARCNACADAGIGDHNYCESLGMGWL